MTEAPAATGTILAVSEKNGDGLSVFEKRLLWGGIVGGLFLFGIILLYFFVLRDTWEADHRAAVVELSEETVALLRRGNQERGLDAYTKLTALLGNRTLRDPDLRRAVADARNTAEPVKSLLEAERAAAERKRKELESLASLRSLESQATTFAQAGQYSRASESYQRALEFIQSNRTDNPEFNAAARRIADAKQKADTQVAEAMRIAEQKRLDAENEAKGLIKVDGKWVSKEQAELAKLKAEMETIKNKPAKVTLTVTWKYNDFVGNKPDTGAVVVLVPDGLTQRLPGAWLAPGFSEILLDSYAKEAVKVGAAIGIVGGDGKAVLNRVKPGKYMAVIVSKNTREEPKLLELEKKSLEQWFVDPGVIGYRSKYKEIEVTPGEDYQTSHDFGITYW